MPSVTTESDGASPPLPDEGKPGLPYFQAVSQTPLSLPPIGSQTRILDWPG